MMDDVIIVGAGPVGLSAALMLAKSGVTVHVIESNLGLSRDSHASVFHPPTLEIFDEFGIAKKLIPLGVKADQIQYRDYHTGPFVDIPYSLIADETKFPFRLHLEQWEFNRLAYSALCDFDNVRITFDRSVTQVANEADHVTVTCDDGSEFSGRWLIGADGSHSLVRDQVGIKASGETYEILNMSVKTTAELEAVMPDIAPITYISGGKGNVSPFGVAALKKPDHWRISCRLVSGQEAEKSLDKAAISRFLHGTVSDKIENYPVMHAYTYIAHRRVAEQFSKGRVILMGDSAHINSPAGGMGMNSGVHDAYVLTDALVGVLQRGRPASDIEAAAELRRKVAVEVVGPRSEGNFSEQFDPEDLELRAQRLKELANDPERSKRYLLERSMLDPAARPQILSSL